MNTEMLKNKKRPVFKRIVVKLGTHLVLRCDDEGQLDEALKSIWRMLEAEGFTRFASEVEPSGSAD